MFAFYKQVSTYTIQPKKRNQELKEAEVLSVVLLVAGAPVLITRYDRHTSNLEIEFMSQDKKESGLVSRKHSLSTRVFRADLDNAVGKVALQIKQGYNMTQFGLYTKFKPRKKIGNYAFSGKAFPVGYSTLVDEAERFFMDNPGLTCNE